MNKTILAGLCALLVASGAARAQNTAFTYQGRLNTANNAATGLYDFGFSLYAASSGGSALTAAVSTNAVPVTNGLFTVMLDFGNQFPGADRWLEIAVRTNGVGVFATLAPRQPLTPAPYAIRAASAGTASSVAAGAVNGLALAGNAVDSSKIGDGSIAANDLSSALLSNTFWRLTGNAGTTAGPNFVGTTDNQPLEAKVNGVRALRLEPGSTANVIGGFSGNSVATGIVGATIGGGGASGFPNRVNATYGTVAGGLGNSVLHNDSFIGAGIGNTVSSDRAVIAGGRDNSIQTNASNSVLGGGRNNRIDLSSDGGVIAGGQSNLIRGFNTSIGGGLNNSINGAPQSVIGGGQGNQLGGGTSGGVIAGGAGNSLAGLNSQSTIGGGGANTINLDAPYATISGGRSNAIGGESISGAIGGGENNAVGARSQGGTVGGGFRNSAGAFCEAVTIGGGVDNRTGLYCHRATIGGGGNNFINGNVVDGSANATIGGGFGNQIDISAGASTIGGGNGNQIAIRSANSTIAGGANNRVSSSGGAFIGGGRENTNSCVYGVVAGGFGNSCFTDAYGTIGGGVRNIIVASYCTISGGDSNRAEDDAAVVGGGYLNRASGEYSTVPGGERNIAGGDYSFAAGRGASANHPGSFVWSDSVGGFSSTADNQFNIRAGGGVRFDAGTSLYFDNSRRQMLNLWSPDFGIGVQDFTLYQRSGDSFAWFKGGTHNDGYLNPGGGATVMSLDGNANLAFNGGLTVDADSSGNGLPGEGIRFGGGSGEGIASKRTAGGNQYGLDFYSGNTARMSILLNGNVGIGTQAPTARFNIQGSVVGGFVSPLAYIENTNTVGNSGPALRVKGAGNPLDGVLSVSSHGIGLIARFGNANAWVSSLDTNGNWCGTTFSTCSDRNVKENFAAVDAKEVLQKVAALPISTWNYKQDTGTKHIGPMSQDFWAAFGAGVDEKHITSVDADGVALAAIQGLNQKLEEQRAENAELKQQLAELRQVVQSLARKLD